MNEKYIVVKNSLECSCTHISCRTKKPLNSFIYSSAVYFCLHCIYATPNDFPSHYNLQVKLGLGEHSTYWAFYSTCYQAVFVYIRYTKTISKGSNVCRLLLTVPNIDGKIHYGSLYVIR